MRIAVVMPRNMRFGPGQPTSIDLCAHDFVRRSRYLADTLVVAEAVVAEVSHQTRNADPR